ncbi:MAG: OmpH family outer membrane protein [Taibaiella sp.]|nr:OmpH family outer membrane protein [Taibaiella sp.]
MKKFLMIFAFGVMAGNIGFAQTKKTTATPAMASEPVEAKEHSGLKIGWIVSGELLASMPEKIKADSDISKFAREFQTQIESMMKEYQTKGQKYQSDEKTMSEAIKEVKMKEIQDLQNRIEIIQQSAKEKVDTKQRDLYQPILDKADKAINTVAREKGFDYIFDRSGGTLLYGREGDNILPLVKAKLGIK